MPQFSLVKPAEPVGAPHCRTNGMVESGLPAALPQLGLRTRSRRRRPRPLVRLSVSVCLVLPNHVTLNSSSIEHRIALRAGGGLGSLPLSSFAIRIRLRYSISQDGRACVRES